MKIVEHYSDVERIRAKLVEEDIVVTYHDEQDVLLKYDGDFNNKIQITCENNELVIERKLSIETLVCIRITKGILQLFLPKPRNIDLKLKSTSGHVQVYVDANQLDIESVSGRLESHGKGTHAIMTTISGGIRQFKPYQRLNFKTTSGNVKLSAKANCDYSGSTVSGSVLIALHENDGYIMRFKSVSGRFIDKYNAKKISGTAELSQGNTKSKFLVSTISGNVKLDDWA
ncbi:MAG: DUF4097 family beta strand repeat-containing protein [Anaerorhabdus sp.]|uniref:DUF4097 family beta strand repeat-containing protein n=1 Tax=Anaerorhabdus sp. TaxID=1872524 RepID=UPI002FC5C408